MCGQRVAELLNSLKKIRARKVKFNQKLIKGESLRNVRVVFIKFKIPLHKVCDRILKKPGKGSL